MCLSEKQEAHKRRHFRAMRESENPETTRTPKQPNARGDSSPHLDTAGTWERAVLGCGASWALRELYHSSLGATRCLTVAPPAPSCNPQKCLSNKELTPRGEPLFKREAKASQMLSVLCNKKKRRPHTGQPPWSAAATQEAGQSGDAEPPCSVKAHHCRVRQDVWFRMPPALPQRHPPPQRALSAQGTRLPCLQALLTGSPLLAPRPATCTHTAPGSSSIIAGPPFNHEGPPHPPPSLPKTQVPCQSLLRALLVALFPPLATQQAGIPHGTEPKWPLSKTEQ